MSRCCTLLACLALAVTAGCSDDGLGTRYPITGKVTYNGQPLAKGTVNFVPTTAEGKGATATITNGEYSGATTLTSGDGILAGEYFVTVSALSDVDMAEVQKEAAGGAFDQVSVGKAQAQAKPLVPLKYSDISASGLKVKVDGQTTYDITLTD